jgi:hypothetical protein
MTAWLDRLTLSQRKLVFAVIAVTLVGLGACSLRLSAQRRQASGAALAPAHHTSERLPDLPGSTHGAVGVEDGGAGGTRLPVSDAEVAAAQAVAERFAVEYATRRWDEPPSARMARLVPLMSPALAAEFSADAGSPALEDERRARREVTTGTPEFAYPQTVSPDRIVFTVVVRQTVTSTQGTKEQRPSFQVVVASHDGAWLVTNLVA